MNPGMRWLVTAGAVALAALIIWLRLPSEEAKVKKAIHSVAKEASFTGGEGNLAKLAKVESIASHFAADAELHIDQVVPIEAALVGRETIKGMLMAGSPYVGSVQVEVHDVQVTLGEPGEARVALTASAKTGGRKGEFTAQEFDLRMVKVEGKWLIRRMEAVAGFRRPSPAGR